MVKFQPVNKLLWVEPVEEKKKEERPFYVPEAAVMKKNSVVTLKRSSDESPFLKHEGKTLVVLTSMLEVIEHKDQKFWVIPENGVQAVIQESELF
jgi:hypothetical protein